MAAQGLVHQCDHPGAKSQQRLLWGLLAPLCPCARQEGKISTHNTLSVCVATSSQPRNGISHILLHLKQTKEGKRERRKGMRRSPEPCQNHSPAPHGAHPHMHPPQDPSPRSSAVQWGSCGQRNLPLPRQQHITSILVTFPFFFTLFLPNSINLLTHSGIYSPKFFTYVGFF